MKTDVDYKDQLTNEKLLKRFNNQFELVRYAIQLAENTIRSGREPIVFEGLNSVGLRRRGFNQKAIELIDNAYVLIYQSSLNVSQAVVRIKEELKQTPEIRNILDFIAGSKRGIIPGPGHH